MAHLRKQNSTAHPLQFLMILSSDHITGATGLTPTVTLSKNGGAFAAAAGAVSEVALGWYQVAGNAIDSNTLGPLALHATATGADPADGDFQIVAFDPDVAFTGTAAAGSANGLALVGSQVDLVNAPNPTAVTAFQNGLSKPGTAQTITAPATMATLANQTTILNAVNAITTNTSRSGPRVPDFMARPSSGSTAYTGDLYLYSLQGAGEDADSNTVTVHARNAVGTSLDAGLTSTTMTRVSASQYRMTYTVNSTDTAQAVYFDFSWAIGGVPMKDGAATEVQDAENYSSLVAIKAKTDLIATNAADSPNAVTSQATISTNLNATMTSRMASFSLPANFSAFSISSSGAVVLAPSQTFTNTNSANQTGDGYAVVNNGTYGNAQLARTSALPANFGTLSITAGQTISTSNFSGGSVTVGGYATGQDPATLLAGTIAAGTNAILNLLNGGQATPSIDAEGPSYVLTIQQIRDAMTLPPSSSTTKVSASVATVADVSITLNQPPIEIINPAQGTVSASGAVSGTVS